MQDGAPRGSWIAARQQTCGRGRKDRTWISPPGNLYLSVLVEIEETKYLGWVPLLSGIVLARWISEQLVSVATTVPQIKVKWPNDVLVDHKKIAGILCEAATSGRNRAQVIIGIGINLNHSPSSTTLRRSATSVRDYLPEFEADLQQISNHLACLLHETLTKDQFDPNFWIQEFDQWSYYKSQQDLQFTDQNGVDVSAKWSGIDRWGRAKAQMASGEIVPLNSEEI